MKRKLLPILVLIVMTTGCASTSKSNFADDFFDGAISSAERRDARLPNRERDTNKELKQDAAAGVITATFSGILDLMFSSDDD